MLRYFTIVHFSVAIVDTQASMNSQGTVIGPFEGQTLLPTLEGSDRASLLQTLCGNQSIIPATDIMSLSFSHVGSFFIVPNHCKYQISLIVIKWNKMGASKRRLGHRKENE